MLKWSASLMVAMALTACVAPDDGLESSEQLPEPVPSLVSERERPQLALLEHILTDYFASDIATRPTVCVSVVDNGEQRGLSDEEETALVLRFEQLAPFDRCQQQDGSWTDSESGKPALVFTMHSFACEQDTRCTGWAGYQTGAAGSMSYDYTMDWLGDEWTFARDPRLIADEPGGAAIQ